jgi:hypothetical protein
LHPQITQIHTDFWKNLKSICEIFGGRRRRRSARFVWGAYVSRVWVVASRDDELVRIRSFEKKFAKVLRAIAVNRPYLMIRVNL